MKPRDKTVLPFALPAISVVVVVLFAMTGKDKQVAKIETPKSESKPFYAATPASPSELNSLAVSNSGPPVWPGAMRRLPPLESESGFVDSDSQLTASLEPIVVSNTEDFEFDDLGVMLPNEESELDLVMTMPSIPQAEQFESPAFEQQLFSPEVANETSANTPKRLESLEIVQSETDEVDLFEFKDLEAEVVKNYVAEAPVVEAEVASDPLFDDLDSVPAIGPLLVSETNEQTLSEEIDRAQPEAALLEPIVVDESVAPIEGPVASAVKKVERKRPWAPVDLRSVQVDMAVGDKDVERTNVASGENKRQAAKAVELGFELIQRGAPYSARARFIESMRSVSRSLDEQNGTHSHTAALRRALSAYQEASDFFPKLTRPDEDINNASVVSGHDTEILGNADVQSMTSGQCVQEYLAYAEQEFTKAFGEEEIASRALYGLGRLEWDTATTTTGSIQVRTYRAISLYQSALVVYDRNFAAANELGVLFARHGNYENAIAALRHCVALSPQSTAWQNLANLYRRLGKLEEARWAEVEATQSASLSPGVPYAVAKPRVEWVNPDEFNSIARRGNTNVAPMQTQTQASNEPVMRSASRPAPPKKRTVARRRSLSFGSRTAK